MVIKKISKYKNTMAHVLNSGGFMEKMFKMENYNDIKDEFIGIVRNPDIVMAPETRNKHERDANRQKNIIQLQTYIYNVGFKSDDMGVIKTR